MIKLTRLNGTAIVINSDLIEFVESSPDTIISLTDGKKIMVQESPDDIIGRVAMFKRMAFGIEKLPERRESIKKES